MIRAKSFWERHWCECIFESKCLTRGGLVWPYFSRADAQTASSPLGPEASRRGAKLVQRLSFTLRCEALQRTRWNTVACLNLTGNSSRSQLERPSWWFYSIFNILGRTLWEPGPHWLPNEIKKQRIPLIFYSWDLLKSQALHFSSPFHGRGFVTALSSGSAACVYSTLNYQRLSRQAFNWLL